MTPEDDGLGWLNRPVTLKDGRLAIVIRDKPGAPTVTLQVPGEEESLEVERVDLFDAGGGCMVEAVEAAPRVGA